MKLTKEDYMRLKKERLAELLVEKDSESPTKAPMELFKKTPIEPTVLGCDGTHCINPFHDCINCPTRFSSACKTTINTSGNDNK